MIPFDVLTLFFTASLLLGIAPGPDNIFVLTQAALHGRSAGLLVTLGLCTGLIVHTALVAIGVAAIFSTSSVAFTVLKFAGAAYLLYLAWQVFAARAAQLTSDPGIHVKATTLYLRGIIMNLTNPKVAIFFLAFLPQFADPQRGSIALQVGLLGAVFMLATLLVFGGIALSAGTLGQWLRQTPRAQLVINRIAGVVFIGLALRLVTLQQ